MFDDIKCGDIVLLNDHGGSKLVKVVNVTKTQITVEHILRNTIACSKEQLKFKRSNGGRYGRDKYEQYRWITPVPSQESLIQYEQQERRALLRQIITATEWKELGTDKLEQIVELLGY